MRDRRGVSALTPVMSGCLATRRDIPASRRISDTEGERL